MNMPLNLYVWLKKYEKTSVALWADIQALDRKGITVQDFIRTVGPLAELEREYFERVLPAMKALSQQMGKTCQLEVGNVECPSSDVTIVESEDNGSAGV